MPIQKVMVEMADVIEQSGANDQEKVPQLSVNGTQSEGSSQKPLKQVPENDSKTQSSPSENILQNGEKKPQSSSNAKQNNEDKPNASTENSAQNGENGADASSPLSEDEVEAINQSFKVLWKEKKENGIELFIKFFTHHPKAQDVFEDFRGLTLEEVRGHKKLRAHVLSVMYAIKSYVDNLDDLETLEQLIRKTARNHKPRGVDALKMSWILQPLLELVEDKMGKDVTDLHRSGWKKVFDVMCALTKDEQENVS